MKYEGATQPPNTASVLLRVCCRKSNAPVSNLLTSTLKMTYRYVYYFFAKSSKNSTAESHARSMLLK